MNVIFSYGLNYEPEFAKVEFKGKIIISLDEKLGKEKSPYQRLVLEFKAATLHAWLEWLMNDALSFAARCPVLPNDVQYFHNDSDP